MWNRLLLPTLVAVFHVSMTMKESLVVAVAKSALAVAATMVVAKGIVAFQEIVAIAAAVVDLIS